MCAAWITAGSTSTYFSYLKSIPVVQASELTWITMKINKPKMVEVLILNAKILLYWQDIKKAYLPLRLTLYLTILKKVIWILLTHNHPLLMPQLSTKSNESQLDSFLHDLIHKHRHQTRLSPLWWEFWYHTIMETKYLIYKNNNVVSFYEVNFYTQIVV